MDHLTALRDLQLQGFIWRSAAGDPAITRVRVALAGQILDAQEKCFRYYVERFKERAPRNLDGQVACPQLLHPVRLLVVQRPAAYYDRGSGLNTHHLGD